MSHFFIKKTFLGFVGFMLVVGLLAHPNLIGSVDAEGGTTTYLPAISSSRSQPQQVPSVSGNSFYVTSNGSSSGNGTMDRPWNLQTAMNHPSAVKPGDTIWVRSGTYRGNFVSKLKGSKDKPISVRAYPGERVTLDAADNSGRSITIEDSSYANFWGFELINSNITRNTTDRPGPGDGINIHSSRTSNNIKFINLVIHDVPSMGIAFWTTTTDSEIYGTVIYNSGGNTFEHGIYTQNQSGTKRIVDNMIFNNSGHGIHGYGSSNAYLNNIHVEGNTIFQNGSIGWNASKSKYSLPQRNILIGGGRVAENPTVISNYTYYTGSDGVALNIGYSAGSRNAKIQNNYFAGGRVVFGGSNSSVSMTGNTIFASGLEGVSSSNYKDNNWLTSKPSGTRVFVRPNKYEAGRANITIYNWDKQSDVNISAGDLSGVALNPGDAYELRNVQDYYGDVISGTYNGSGISVPMNGRKVAQPVGLGFKPPSTFPEFGAFVLIVPGK
jgi:hypothetical protein